MSQYAIDDGLAKPFSIWRTDINDKPFERLAQYDTIEEVEKHHFRTDWAYKIQVGRRFMTRPEFGEWKKKLRGGDPIEKRSHLAER
jgi:hypothetical protein